MSAVTPESWPVISALLDEALSLPVEQRDTWLESLDGERAALKDTLRKLLSRADGVETGDFLATLPRLTRVAPTNLSGALTELAAGDAIGPYRLLSELGTGGMGAVWLAERADGTLKRKVALKLPRLVWARGLAERMARERDILASLEHPNIARLYDAGVDQHGRPYLALEYVEGQSIDVYAKERNLTVRQKLDLLLQVCGAVAFAHSRLVVHRDLKPSNILVTEDGQVRLLDFGIAKLMEGDSARETQLTQLSGRALTLDYASPEQIKGEPIGTASDVYSLGVVAYELLTGAKPYKLKRGTAAELEEAIATIDPLKASDAATFPHDRKALRGDLDAIVNQALKKSPADRYPTVDALSQDIERHCRDKPVMARPDSVRYRMKKLVARNPGTTAAIGAAVGAVVLGMTVAIWQAREASQAARLAEERAREAQREANRAKAVQNFLTEIFARNSQLQGDAVKARATTVRELLDIGAERVTGALAEYPEAQVQMLDLFSNMYFELALDSEARRLAAERVQAARKAFAADDVRLAEALMAYAATLVMTGRKDVPAVLEEARRIVDLAGEQGIPLKARLLTEVADFERYESLPRLLRSADEATAFLSKHFPDSSGRINPTRLAARSRLIAAQYAEAERLARIAVELAARQGDAAPGWSLGALSELGEAQREQGKLAEAEQSYRDAVKQSVRANGIDHPQTLTAQISLASLLLQNGHRDEAEALAGDVLRQLERIERRIPEWRVLNIRAIFAKARFELAMPGEIRRYVADDVRDLRESLPNSVAFAYRLRLLAEVELRSDRFAQAATLLDEGELVWQRYAGDRPPATRQQEFILSRARLATASGRPVEALVRLQAIPTAVPDTVEFQAVPTEGEIERAAAALLVGRPDEARASAERALTALRSIPSGRLPMMEARALCFLGRAQAALGDRAAALTTLEAAVRLHEEHGPRLSLWRAQAENALAEVVARSDPSRARQLATSSARIVAAHPSSGPQWRQRVLGL